MWHPFETSELYLNALVDRVSAILRQATQNQGQAHMAVSGGHSPIPFFNALSDVDLDWPNIHISLVDERFVAPNTDDSNEHLVRTHLLIGKARRAHFTGLVSDTGDINRCLDQANQQTQALTLAILGMGEDGHTASLFPKAPELADALDMTQSRRYVRITPAAAPHERISMTLAALLHTQQLILTISGSEKRRVYEQAAQGATPDHPVSYLITQTEAPFDVYWHA